MFDKTDCRLLELLAQNCRLSNTTLAKALKISKDTVRYRLQKLEDNNVVTYLPLINDAKLGLSVYHLFVRVKNADTESFQKTVEHMQQHPSTAFVSELSGKYDLQAIMYVRNRREAEAIKDELCKENVRSYKLYMYLAPYAYSALLPTTRLGTTFKPSTDSSFSKFFADMKEIDFPVVTHVERFDKMDLKIIAELGKNARASLTEIAETVGLTGEGVKQRIKTLIRKGIIVGFIAFTETKAFNYFNYCLLLELKEDSPVVKEYFMNHPNIFYANKLTDNKGIAYIIAKDPYELQEHISDMREKLSEQVLDYEVLIHLHWHKFTHVPEMMLKLKNQ